MIVRRDGHDWLVMTQPDHAALAGDLMEAWRADGLPDRPTRARVLRALREHDDGWRETDAAPLVDAEGNPYDYMKIPLPIRQGIWPRTVDRLAADDAYVAALVAQHAVTVYRRYHADPAWQDFFTQMGQRRDDLVARVMTESASAGSASFGSFLLDYTVLGVGDLFSQVFCNGWPQPYLIEGYQAILRDDRLTISPDPFDGATVALEVVARRIPARPYASDQDLRDTLAQAPSQRLTGLAIGGERQPIT
jgi:hypothetical protein